MKVGDSIGFRDLINEYIFIKDVETTATPLQPDQLNSTVVFPQSHDEQFLKYFHIPILFNNSIAGGVDIFNSGAPTFDFYGIDFGKSRLRIIITIYPPDNLVNNGKPIVIPIYSGSECVFGDKSACVSAFRTSKEGNVIFLSIHSGVGGEAQNLRHAIEGTGINRAGYNIEKVINNLEALNGASVTILQDDIEITGLRLVATARIPAQSLANYFQTPISSALYQAANSNPNLIDVIHPKSNQLVIETCGWKMRGEPWADEVTPTTASIYLGVIQKQ